MREKKTGVELAYEWFVYSLNAYVAVHAVFTRDWFWAFACGALAAYLGFDIQRDYQRFRRPDKNKEN